MKLKRNYLILNPTLTLHTSQSKKYQEVHARSYDLKLLRDRDESE